MLYNHKTYTLEIARTLKELLHTDDEPHWHRIFGMADIEEFIANQILTDGYQLLMEDMDNSRIIRDDRPVNRDYYAFYVAKSFTGGDYDSKESAKEGCKTVANKIISKYLKDYKADAAFPIPNQNHGLSQLEPTSFSIQTMGPFGDNYIAAYVSFTIQNSPNLEYNASDWTE